MKPLVLFFVFAAALTGCEENHYTEADGAPGGKNSYWPHDEAERNMGQTGVDDAGIDLGTRIQYAREHGLPPPRTTP